MVERELAWHDVTCPEGESCRDRMAHATAGSHVVNTGLLTRYHERLVELLGYKVETPV